MQHFKRLSSVIIKALGIVLLLAGCDAILIIKTNVDELDCATLMKDAYCIKVRTAEIDSVKDLVINHEKILSDQSSFNLSWTMPETAKRILATKVMLASDAACTTEVAALELDSKTQTNKFSDIKDGIYYGCVFAKAKSAGLVAANNNGIRIVVETVPPAIAAPFSILNSKGDNLEKGFSASAKSALKYIWTQTGGPGELVFSDPRAAAPTLKASVDGTYTVEVTAENEVGKKSSKILTIKIDTTNPGDPTAVSVPVATNAGVSIAFTAGTELNPAAFNIKACTSACTGGCVGETTTNAARGAIAATALTNGNSYRGCVQATDQVGNTSAWVPSATSVAFDTTAPIAPSGLSVASFSNSSTLIATFSAGTDANLSTHSFKACTANTCSSGCLAAVAAPTSPARLTGLVDGTAYYICGQALDLASNSSPFSFTPATVTIDATAPTDPTAVSVPSGAESSFSIFFTAGSDKNPGRFNLKACTASTCSSGCIGATTTASSPGTIAASALVLGTSYYGCVQGADLAGNTSAFVVSLTPVLYNTFAFTYNANSSTSGSVPVDATAYAYSATVTVLGNTGSLIRTGYTFNNWNTAANGSGTSYSPAQTLSIMANTTLYAQWAAVCTGLAGGTFVTVPGDNIYGTSPFCLQKYAAANIGSVPTAQSGSAPWVNINQTNSIAKCAALGAGYHSVTNPEWMTIAANLANVGANWSSGTVGSGTLRRGHGDNNPANGCAANASDANAYVETNCTGTSSGTFIERRTSSLSNGAVVWDIGGNVWTWVNYNNAADKPTPATGAWYEYTAITGSTTTPKSLLVPLNSAQSWWTDSWNSTQGIGQIYPSTNGSGGVLRRGASWIDGAVAGAFSVDLYHAPPNSGSNIGFRCAYTPNTFAVTYDANAATGGSPPNDPTIYASGSTVTVQGNTLLLTRTGYTHVGWTTGVSGVSYTAGQTFTIAANTILYAKWSNCTGLLGGTWVSVPADAVYGTAAFCVQKYTASDVATLPTSQTGTTPWVSITMANASTACTSLGGGYHLLTNPEWMAIAANAANIGINWSSGSVGTGNLRRGHSDGSPGSGCATDTNDANAYVQTTCTGTSSGTFSERRTSFLVNGDVIWDIGGNVYNWINYANSTDKPTPATGAWTEFTGVTGSTATPKSHLVPLNSAQAWWNDSWTSTQGIGQNYPGNNGSGGVMSRGGRFNDNAYVGMFGANLNSGNAATQTYIGFRCAY